MSDDTSCPHCGYPNVASPAESAYEEAARWCEERADAMIADAHKRFAHDEDRRQRKLDAAEWVRGCADTIRHRASRLTQVEAR